ncbi:MAG: 30S ribosomal protein S8e [Nanobdellota archaeon]
MAISQRQSKRSFTGARLSVGRKKKKLEAGRLPVLTKVGSRQFKRIRTMGGNAKDKLLHENIVNVYNPNEKKSEKATISTVVDNKANRNFIRRNILTKGTVVNTDKGQVKITNRPGQEGSINGILVQ